MAFNILNLEGMGGQSKRGRTVQKYAYRTTDGIATTAALGYYNDIQNKLEVGDIIEEQHVTYEADGVTVATLNGIWVHVVAINEPGLLFFSTNNDYDSETYVTKLTDVSTASTIALTSGIFGEIVAIDTILGGAITVGDAAITFDIDGTAIDNSAITVANAGSAIGDEDNSNPSGARTVTNTSVITATTDGGSTTAQALYIIYHVVSKGAVSRTTLTPSLADCSTASQVYTVSPVAGRIANIYSVINNAITVGDATITAKINGTGITGGTITIATAASAAGDVDSCTPTALNVVAVGDNIELETDGGSTDACITNFAIEII